MYVLIYAFAFLALCCSALLFIAKSMVRAVVLFALSALFSAGLMVAINQELIAILQIFIFVGGLSTYFVVSFGSETSKIRPVLKGLGIFALFIALGASLVYAYSRSPVPSLSKGSVQALLASSFSTYYPFLALLALLVFGAALGSILAIKRLRR